jgi:GT2 family glycosyltransferase
MVVDCLQSMMEEVGAISGCSVVVVDNDSGDGSADLIARAVEDHGWNEWVSLVCATENLGFARGNNEAIRAATAGGPLPDYVLFLNPDTRIRPGAFRVLIDFLETHPKVGIAGGRSEDPDGTPQLCCFRFPGLVSEVSLYLGLGIFDRLVEKKLTRMGIPEEPTEVGWVAGALMMVRREVFQDIGLMDEGYFLY